MGMIVKMKRIRMEQLNNDLDIRRACLCLTLQEMNGICLAGLLTFLYIYENKRLLDIHINVQ